MSYQAPDKILEVLQKIEYEEALAADDPRFVDTTVARGSQKTLDRLAKKFGLNLSDGRFVPATQNMYCFLGMSAAARPRN